MNFPLFRQVGWAALSCAALLAGAGCAHEKSAPQAPATPAPVVPAKAAPLAPGASKPLFDGRTLTGWEPSDFSGRGQITVERGEIKVGLGHMTGLTWTNAAELPHMNYEISFDAMRTDGSDFFCGLTFPVGTNSCSFIAGGWGGGTVGLSNIDSEDASSNETTSSMNFANNRWFHFRVRVEPGKIQAWIDEDRVVNLDTADKRIGIRLEMEACVPLGLATWNTAAAWKNIQIKKL